MFEMGIKDWSGGVGIGLMEVVEYDLGAGGMTHEYGFAVWVFGALVLLNVA